MSSGSHNKKYVLWRDSPHTSPYYQMRQSESGWQWVWVEDFEPEDVGPVLPSRAEALWEAAKDSDAHVNGDAGRDLANRLRAASRAVRS